MSFFWIIVMRPLPLFLHIRVAHIGEYCASQSQTPATQKIAPRFTRPPQGALRPEDTLQATDGPASVPGMKTCTKFRRHV